MKGCLVSYKERKIFKSVSNDAIIINCFLSMKICGHL